MKGQRLDERLVDEGLAENRSRAKALIMTGRVLVDDVPVDSGGEGRVRIWRDDELIFDRTDVPTITEDQGTINSFLLFTYWNNETPPNNHVFVDDLVIATSASPPPNVDASGHAVIGSWPE